MSQLQRIQEKITKLKALDVGFQLFGASHHKYEINGIIEESEIFSFENKYQIKLPKGYRDFISTIGDGPCGPYYGLVSFTDCLLDDLDRPNEKIFVNPSKPFIHNTKWNLDLGDMYEPADQQYYDTKSEEQYFDPKWMNGTIKLANFGCGVTINLVVNGDEYGNIWADDRGSDQGIYPDAYSGNQERIKFLDWYEYWLNQSFKEIKKYPLKNTIEKLNKNKGTSFWTTVKRLFSTNK